MNISRCKSEAILAFRQDKNVCNFLYIWLKWWNMEAVEQVSTFAKIVDKLRGMNDAELNNAYLKLFKEDLEEEWDILTKELTFGDATDEDILFSIQKSRYNK